MKAFSVATKEFLDNLEQDKARFVAHCALLDEAVQGIKSESPALSEEQVYKQALLTLRDTISKSSYKLYQQVPPQALITQCDVLLLDNMHLFNNLELKGKIRCRKQATIIPRTFTLALENDGSIAMYLEPKSKIGSIPEMLGRETIEKLSNNEKEALKKSGTTKTGKPCWKFSASSSPEEYFSLVYNTPLGNITNKLPNQTEEEYVAQFEHPFATETKNANKFDTHVDCLEGGTIYVTKDDLIKAVSYSKAAISSLDKFISETEEGLITPDNKKASEEEKYKLIKDMLLGVKAMHDKGYVHQDLKPPNILVYETLDPRTGKVGMQAKISDFGSTTPVVNPTYEPIATLHFASPEIFDFQRYLRNQYFEDPYFAYGRLQHRDRVFADPQYIRGKQEGLSIAELNMIANQILAQFANVNNKAAKHNDMWAMGIVAYEILYGKLPNNASPTYEEELKIFKDNIAGNGFLSGLLDIDKNTRLTIDQALQKIDFRIPIAADTKALTEEHVEAIAKAEAERVAVSVRPNTPSKQ
jgi:serine/threonine protein kinase